MKKEISRKQRVKHARKIAKKVASLIERARDGDLNAVNTIKLQLQKSHDFKLAFSDYESICGKVVFKSERQEEAGHCLQLDVSTPSSNIRKIDRDRRRK